MTDSEKMRDAASWLPCPLCGESLHYEGDGMEHPASDTCPLDSMWMPPEHSVAWNRRIPDMAAAIAERDAEIERLTARAEAAEAREAALLAANDVNRKLMLERNAELARWKKMADRLVFDLNKAREWDWISFEEMRNAENGELVAEECLPTLCALDRSIGADLATYAAMKEGR